MTLEPDDRITLIKHRLNRARETQTESLLLFDNGMFPAVVNRIYYSMFYSLSALAISEGFETGKHAQLIGWFNKTWVRTGKVETRYSKIISRAFDKRMLGDYADIPDFSKPEVEIMITESGEFIEMVEKLLSKI
jgi:uncharacterized protein (UPF0332 family)